MKKHDSDDNTQFLPIGMCIGLSIGVALGAAMDNIPIGMCLGLSIGLCFGTAIDAAKGRNNEETKDDEQKKDE